MKYLAAVQRTPSHVNHAAVQVYEKRMESCFRKTDQEAVLAKQEFDAIVSKYGRLDL